MSVFFKKSLFLVIPVFLSLVPPANAVARPSWEIWTGPMASLQLYNGYSTISVFSNYAPNLLGPSFGYLLSNYVELRFSPSFTRTESGRSSLNVPQLTAGLTFNFNSTFEDSAYLTIEAGALYDDWRDSFEFVSNLSIGKRFPVVTHVTYNPQITFHYIPIISESFSIIPVQFSFSW